MSEPKPMPSYWALAEEVTHLHGYLDKLQADNAKLRESRAEMYQRAKAYSFENAKLRERIEELESCAVAPPLEEQLLSALDENAKLLVTCAKLREVCAELLDMAESHDPEWFHWPEMYEELRKLGVDV